MYAVPETALRQVDAEVARRVMGFEHVDVYRYVRQKFGRPYQSEGAYETWRAKWMDDHQHQWPLEDVVEEYGVSQLMYWGVGEPRPVPYFSTEADHVWDVFDHLRKHGVYASVGPEHGPGANYRVRAWRAYTGERLAEATGPELPFLVCTVALAAAGRMGDAYVHDGECR